jgi:tetratricopeptide (TPR) repeat protein
MPKFSTFSLLMLFLCSLHVLTFFCTYAQTANTNNNIATPTINPVASPTNSASKKTTVILPFVSPKAYLQQLVGYTEIKIEYYRPSVKGRKIWGDIVPYRKVWRTGANKATTIEFSDDVLLNGQKIRAGKYALYSIPDKNEWTILLNKNADSWGTEDYREEDNVVIFKVKPLKGNFEETFKIEISNVDKRKADIFIEWEKLVIPIELQVELEEKVVKNIEEAIKNAKQEDWEVFATCADYCLKNGILLDRVNEWIEKALNGNPKSFRPYWLKADYFALQGQFREAIDMAKQALHFGNIERGEKFSYKTDLERAIALWQSKLQ